MSPGLQIALAFGVTHGFAMILAWWELRGVRRTPRGRPGGNAVPPRITPLPPTERKPLPDCLIPKPFNTTPPVRLRELA
jgi:hypothetical protein